MSTTTYIPLFPLGIVAFPGEPVNLHIFEPRYRQMVNECQTGAAAPFAVIPFFDGKLQGIGTELEIEEIVKRYEGGEMDIRTRGMRKVEVQQFDKVAPGKKYPGGAVTYQEVTDYEGDPVAQQKLFDYFTRLHQALGTEKKLYQSADEFVSFDIGHQVGLSIDQEYELLQIASEVDRQEFLIQHLDQILPYVRQTKDLEERIKLNGHFRSISSPEL